MDAKERAKQTEEAVKLRLSGATYEAIARRLGLTPRTIKTRVEKALERMPRETVEASHLLDLARIDNAIISVTRAISAGEVGLVKHLVALQQERRDCQARYVAVSRYGETSLRKAAESSIAKMTWLAPTDEAAKQATIVAASAVDDLLAAGETSKAVFALPHLVNSLESLGGTPSSRKKLQQSAEDGDDELSQLRRRRRGDRTA